MICLCPKCGSEMKMLCETRSLYVLALPVIRCHRCWTEVCATLGDIQPVADELAKSLIRVVGPSAEVVADPPDGFVWAYRGSEYECYGNLRCYGSNAFAELLSLIQKGIQKANVCIDTTTDGDGFTKPFAKPILTGGER